MFNNFTENIVLNQVGVIDLFERFLVDLESQPLQNFSDIHTTLRSLICLSPVIHTHSF
jgi:hypothetical protein